MQDAMKWLKQATEPAIIYDFDVDGITSCALIIKILKRMKKDVMNYTASPRPNFEKNPALELTKYYEDLIVLDISLDKNDIKKFANDRILNIDHHDTGLFENYENAVIFKNKGKYTPTAKMVYDLGMKLFKDFEKEDWIACAGVISDFGGPTHTEFVKKILKKYGYKTGRNKKFFETKLGEIGHVINSVRITGDIKKAGMAVKVLLECEGPEDFLKAESAKTRLLYNNYSKIADAIEQELERFRDKSQKKGKRILFTLKNQKYNLRSTICTILSSRMKETIAIAEERKTDYIHISMRSRKGDLLEIIDELKKHVETVGGGHKNAAGLTIKKEDFPIFKRIFLQN